MTRPLLQAVAVTAALAFAGCCGAPYYDQVLTALNAKPETERALLERLGIASDGLDVTIYRTRDEISTWDRSRGDALHRAVWFSPGWHGAESLADGREPGRTRPTISHVRKILTHEDRVCVPLSESSMLGPSSVLVFVGAGGEVLGWLDTTRYEQRRRHTEIRARMPEIGTAEASGRMWSMTALELLDKVSVDTLRQWIRAAPTSGKRADLAAFHDLVRAARHGESPAETRARRLGE